jgi:addiction module RelB/DinJ family antitoxin
MNTLLRVRVRPELLAEANRVCAGMALDVQDAVRLFLAALVRRKGIPFPVEAADNLAVPIEHVRKVWEALGPAPEVNDEAR